MGQAARLPTIRGLQDKSGGSKASASTPAPRRSRGHKRHTWPSGLPLCLRGRRCKVTEESQGPRPQESAAQAAKPFCPVSPPTSRWGVEMRWTALSPLPFSIWSLRANSCQNCPSQHRENTELCGDPEQRPQTRGQAAADHCPLGPPFPGRKLPLSSGLMQQARGPIGGGGSPGQR